MIAKESYHKLHKASTFARQRHDFCQAAARRFKLHSPLSFGESFMKIRSAVPENGCLIANHQHSPGGGTTFAKWRHDVSNYISPLLFGESFMKIRLAVPENGCLIVLVDGKNKKQKKTKNKKNCKTYTHPPPTGRQLRKKDWEPCMCLLPYFTEVKSSENCEMQPVSFGSSSLSISQISKIFSVPNPNLSCNPMIR